VFPGLLPIRVSGRVRVVVTEIGWDGSMRRRALDTCGLTEAGPWESLIEQVLAFSPPYRAAPGSPVYVIHAADRAVLASPATRAPGQLHAASAPWPAPVG
jgi:hypothetical protein